MQEITSTVKLRCLMPNEHISFPCTVLDINLKNIEKKLEKISCCFPQHKEDEVKIILILEHNPEYNRVFGHPIEFRVGK